MKSMTFYNDIPVVKNMSSINNRGVVNVLCGLMILAGCSFLPCPSTATAGQWLVSLKQEENKKQDEKTEQEEKNDKEDESDEKQEEELVTVRGQLVLVSDIITELDWDELTVVLVQNVTVRQPDYPEDWATMTPEKRTEWMKAFTESEAGKKLIAQNDEVLKNQIRRPIEMRKEGKFIVYDLPKGTWDLQAFLEKKVDDKTYILQSFGKFEIGEVDEVDLAKMPVDVLRLLQMEEEAPNIEGKTIDDKDIALSDYRGKHVLLAFGTVANPAFKQTTKFLKQAKKDSVNGDKLQVLTVTTDEDLDAVDKFNQENDVDWDCLNLGGWKQETLSEYGLKMVPSLWLIDPQGKVVLTGQQFLFELNRTRFPLGKLIDEVIAGRLVIGGEPAEEEDEKKSEDKKKSDDQ